MSRLAPWRNRASARLGLDIVRALHTLGMAFEDAQGVFKRLGADRPRLSTSRRPAAGPPKAAPAPSSGASGGSMPPERRAPGAGSDPVQSRARGTWKSTRRPSPQSTACHFAMSKSITATAAVGNFAKSASSGGAASSARANAPMPGWCPSTSRLAAFGARLQHREHRLGRGVIERPLQRHMRGAGLLRDDLPGLAGAQRVGHQRMVGHVSHRRFSHFPISAAALRPRLLSGRSSSARPGSSQLDLAWRIRIRRRMVALLGMKRRHVKGRLRRVAAARHRPGRRGAPRSRRSCSPARHRSRGSHGRPPLHSPPRSAPRAGRRWCRAPGSRRRADARAAADRSRPGRASAPRNDTKSPARSCTISPTGDCQMCPLRRAQAVKGAQGGPRTERPPARPGARRARRSPAPTSGRAGRAVRPRASGLARNRLQNPGSSGPSRTSVPVPSGTGSSPRT